MHFYIKIGGLIVILGIMPSLNASMQMKQSPLECKMTSVLIKLKTMLLTDPEQLLDYNKKTLDERTLKLAHKASLESPAQLKTLFSEEKNSEALIKLLKENSTLGQQENPIYHLTECRKKACPLTRSNRPELRAHFEKDAASAIFQAARSNNGMVHVIDFGSGMMFPTLRVATHALQKGVRDLHIHLFEPEDEPYVDFITLYNNGAAEAGSPAVFDKIDQVYKEIKEEKKQSTTELSKVAKWANKAEIAQLLQNNHERLSQLLQWAKIHYPKQKCTLYMHKDISSYQQFIAKNPGCVADVATTCDWDVEDSEVSQESSIGKAWLSLITMLSSSRKAISYIHLLKSSFFGKSGLPYIKYLSPYGQVPASPGYEQQQELEYHKLIEWHKKKLMRQKVPQKRKP